jgi:transposase
VDVTVRKTFKHKLTPAPDQIQALELVLQRCRMLYNTAERKAAWERSGVSVTYYQQQEAHSLVQQHDTIYFEGMQAANMVSNHSLAKSAVDVGWRAFLSVLVFRAAYAGKQAVAVPPAYTSQHCSGYGRVVRKGLSVRWRRCPYEDCGASLHRDHNAALNILALGKKQGAVGQTAQARP